MVDNSNTSSVLSSTQLKQRIYKDRDGSVIISGIPMVDQGDKVTVLAQ